MGGWYGHEKTPLWYYFMDGQYYIVWRRAMTERLLEWYKKNHRPLPWRENPHPYAIWVSEIMAQQTRINQLLPYYKKFMEAFPDVKKLAAASLGEVLSVWAGMGYYARARNLHRAACIIGQNGWPKNKKEWLSMPGVGDYTAGAIASIVYGERVAAVDGNALRVYARLANDFTDITTPAAKKAAAHFFYTYMPETKKDMQIYNQAIMEFGALVCLPLKPLCDDCPLQMDCQAYGNKTCNSLPVKKIKKPSPKIEMTVILAINPKGEALTRRREEGLLNGMTVYLLQEGFVDPVEYLSGLRLNAISAIPIGKKRHVFTHRTWEMEGHAVYVEETNPPEGYQFMTKDEIKNAPFPAAVSFFTDWFLFNYRP
jgi:A/G-specific adenine glycosylase